MAFSPSDAAFEGFRLTRRAPLAVLLWAAVTLVAMALIFLVAGGSLIQFISVAQSVGEAGEPTDAEMASFMQAYLGFLGILGPIGLVLNAVLVTAIHRAVLRPEERAFGYLRLGMDEVRVFFVTLVLTLLFIVIGVALGIGLGVAAGITGATTGNEGAAVGVGLLGALVMVVVLVWLSVRLSLAVPITVAERRFSLFDSWGMTKGRTWSLIGMALLAFIMAMVVGVLLNIVTWPALMAVGASGFSGLETMNEFDPMVLMRDFGALIVIYGIFTAISSTLQNVLLYAPFAAAYRALKGS